MGVGRLIMAAAAWRFGRERSPQNNIENGQSALLGSESQPSRLAAGISRRSYGATEVVSGSPGILGRIQSHSPETYCNGALARVPEDRVYEDPDTFDEEEFLEERGIYIGSYQQLVSWYTLVPVTCILIWLALAFLPRLLWHTPHPSSPTPFPELLLSISLWSLSHLLSTPIFTLSSALFRLPPGPTTIFSTALHVLLRNLLRLAALPILRVRHYMDYPHPNPADPAFWRVWWLALGWSLAEVAVGVAQGYEQIGLYRNALVPAARVHELEALTRAQTKQPRVGSGERGGSSSRAASAHDDSRRGDSAVREPDRRPTMQRWPSEAEMVLEVERDLDTLITLKAREELEDMYGIPFIHIPVFVSCLLRIASIALSLGFLLLLSAAYLSAPLSRSSLLFAASSHPPIFTTNGAFYVTFSLVFLLHFSISLLHTPMVLPKIGVHVVAYVGFLIGLGSIFAGLGMWGALA